MSAVSRARRARAVEVVARVVTGAMALSVVAIAVYILGYIVVQGAPALSLEFLASVPRDRGREGGIFPIIMGTVYVTVGTALLTLPIGVLAGIYLSEYAPRNLTTRAIRLAITNMAGVPSIVYGLFGLAACVRLAGFGRSV
ncbi:MAG: phosphate ABC transporter, permease protein PstA, partial [Coriobacteriia bacterium]